jgi:hypothetical protein
MNIPLALLVLFPVQIFYHLHLTARPYAVIASCRSVGGLGYAQMLAITGTRSGFGQILRHRPGHDDRNIKSDPLQCTREDLSLVEH